MRYTIEVSLDKEILYRKYKEIKAYLESSGNIEKVEGYVACPGPDSDYTIDGFVMETTDLDDIRYIKWAIGEIIEKGETK